MKINVHYTLIHRVLHKISFRFVQPYLQVKAIVNSWAYQIKDHNSYVLCRWVQVFKLRAIFVQVFMVKAIDYFFLNDITQFFHIYYITRIRINGAGNLYKYFIIMAVVIRIIALAKNHIVCGLIPLRIVQAVGCIESLLSKNGYSAHNDSPSPKYST